MAILGRGTVGRTRWHYSGFSFLSPHTLCTVLCISSGIMLINAPSVCRYWQKSTNSQRRSTRSLLKISKMAIRKIHCACEPLTQATDVNTPRRLSQNRLNHLRQHNFKSGFKNATQCQAPPARKPGIRLFFIFGLRQAILLIPIHAPSAPWRQIGDADKSIMLMISIDDTYAT